MGQYLTFIFLVTTTFFITNISFAQEPKSFGNFNVKAAIDSLPETSIKPFVEIRLVDNGEIGVRVLRVYNPVPRHSHAYSSTYLKIESGRALFSIDGGKPFEAGAGDFVFWERGVEHEVLQILEHPLTFLAIDSPTRREGDIQVR
ncbi:MAG: cupin domain-containing protein [Gammaproteobacteria bacterium]|jgi:mannose-6-phosphate isomerase-like protein (cupin superfamily)